MSKDRGELVAAFIVVLTMGLIILGAFLRQPPKAEEKAVAAAPALAAPQDLKPALDPSDLARDEAYRTSNRKGFRELLALFHRRGLTCPAITHMWDRGISPYGQKLEVLCGPAGTADAYPKLHYAVYPERGEVSVCAEFGLNWGHNC